MIAVLMVLVILLIGAVQRVDGYVAFIEGAQEGLRTALHITPYLCAALMLTASLRGSGLLEALEGLLRPFLARLGVPVELIPFLVMKPVSGSGALSVLGELMQHHGADSDAARMAAVMMGSGETVLYVLSVYLGAVKLRRSGYVLPVALVAMLVGMVVSCALLRL